MSFWSMSVSGGIFILAIVIIRSLFADKLPGKVFQVLWFAAVLRLLLPFSIPSAFSIYSLAADYIPISYNYAEKSVFDILPFLKQGQTDSQEETEEGTSYGQLAEGRMVLARLQRNINLMISRQRQRIWQSRKNP